MDITFSATTKKNIVISLCTSDFVIVGGSMLIFLSLSLYMYIYSVYIHVHPVDDAAIRR